MAGQKWTSIGRLVGFCLLSSTVFAASGCAAVYWLGMQVVYDEVPLPASQIVTNIPYDPAAPADAKRQLDLFLPKGRNWPAVVFIHGGGWTVGDRALQVGGKDVYGNIGRMLATAGFGAAVISYRLRDEQTDWRTQAGDVARAVAWAQREMPQHGARPGGVFLMGHSAGAQLAMRIAAEPAWLDAAGGQPSGICGVVAASGAAYDLEDEVTRRLDNDDEYYEWRFADAASGAEWRRAASPMLALDARDPPFLFLLAENDYPSVHRQTRLAEARLNALGRSAGLVIVRKADHERVVIELSKADNPAGMAILRFLRETPCPR